MIIKRKAVKANEKIIVFIVLAILSMVTAAVSFVANDIGSYRHWIAENKPAIMETLTTRTGTSVLMKNAG